MKEYIGFGLFIGFVNINKKYKITVSSSTNAGVEYVAPCGSLTAPVFQLQLFCPCLDAGVGQTQSHGQHGGAAAGVP